MTLFEPFKDHAKMEALSQLASSTAEQIDPMADMILQEAELLLKGGHTAGPTASALLIRRHARQLAKIADCLRRFAGTDVVPLETVSIGATLRGMRRLLSLLVGHEQELIAECPDESLFVQANQRTIEDVLCTAVAMASSQAAHNSIVCVTAYRSKSDSHEANRSKIRIDIVFKPQGSASINWGAEFEPRFRLKKSGVSLGAASMYGAVTKANAKLQLHQSSLVTIQLDLPNFQSSGPLAVVGMGNAADVTYPSV